MKQITEAKRNHEANWRLLRRVVLVIFAAVFALALFVAAFRAEEDWRAECDLKNYESGLRAKGESLDFSDFKPPPVPDDQNFAAAPYVVSLMKAQGERVAGKSEGPKPPNLRRPDVSEGIPSLGGWTIGKPVDVVAWQQYLEGSKNQAAISHEEAAHRVLVALRKYSHEVDEFSAAADRKYARFPLQYEKGITMQVPHLTMMLQFPQFYCLRGIAAIEAGDSDSALRDLNTIFRIQAALSSEPLLISHLVRISILQLEEQLVWQGMVEHRWRPDQLNQIKELLGSSDLLRDYERVIRSERAGARLTFNAAAVSRDERRRMLDGLEAIVLNPRPWRPLFGIFPSRVIFYRNEIANDHWAQDILQQVVNSQLHRIYPKRQMALDGEIERTRRTPYNFLAKLTLEVYRGITLRTTASAGAIDHARIVCAIELFRMEKGVLPQTLAELDSALPHDLITAAPTRYLRTNNSYILYSVGWNEVDDGGKVATKSSMKNKRDDEQGDWVWFAQPVP